MTTTHLNSARLAAVRLALASQASAGDWQISRRHRRDHSRRCVVAEATAVAYRTKVASLAQIGTGVRTVAGIKAAAGLVA